MICKKCETQMVVGQAIKPAVEDFGVRIVAINHTIKPEELTIIDCWKCPNCGHSEYLEGEEPPQ